MNTAFSRPLIYLGWSLYVIALFCPAFRLVDTTLPGWKCLLATLSICPLVLSWSVGLFGFTNLLFLSGLLVYAWGGGLERKAYGVFLGLAACATIAAMISMREDARVGAYLWLGSLVVTAVGFYLAESVSGASRNEARFNPPRSSASKAPRSGRRRGDS